MGMDFARILHRVGQFARRSVQGKKLDGAVFPPGWQVRLCPVATSARQGPTVVLSMHVTIAGQVRAVEADRLILLAGTVVRIPPELDVPRLGVGFGVTVVAEEHGGELTALNIRPSLGPFLI
jgi:hypothetical protein